MAGSDLPHDPKKALEFKNKGNDHFQNKNYEAAEQLYSKAISLDPLNPILHTNQSKALLKLARYPEAIASSESAIAAISSAPINSVYMKAYYNIAQAYHALRDYDSALKAAEMAREHCIKDMPIGGNGDAMDIDTEEITKEWEKKIEEVERMFRLVETQGKDGRRREMPDWAIDGISFNVMIDPVVTKTGQSYERTSILQHLERSCTDPLTREPLIPSDLRPNLGLRHAIEEFLEENGWAVEW
ncbi:STIP1-like protein [Botrytis cinerea]